MSLLSLGKEREMHTKESAENLCSRTQPRVGCL